MPRIAIAGKVKIARSGAAQSIAPASSAVLHAAAGQGGRFGGAADSFGAAGRGQARAPRRAVPDRAIGLVDWPARRAARIGRPGFR